MTHARVGKGVAIVLVRGPKVSRVQAFYKHAVGFLLGGWRALGNVVGEGAIVGRYQGAIVVPRGGAQKGFGQLAAIGFPR